MKLGINTYTFMWAIGFPGAHPEHPLDGLGLLAKARQLGVTLVQTGPNLALEDPGLWRDFLQAARQEGFTLELGIRGLEKEHLLRWIERCQQADAHLLRTVPELGGETPAAEAVVQALDAVRPALEHSGVVLGLENGRIPCRILRWIIERMESPSFGVVLDMVNSLAVPEGWKEVTSVLAPHTACLHFKDFAIHRAWHQMGFICEGRPAGQGQLDAPWLFQALAASRFDFNVILELWTPQQNTLDETIALEQAWAEASIAYLRQFVKG